MVGDSVSELGKGGMKTKISAAKTAIASGCHMAITNGTIDNPIKALFKKRPCTWFKPSRTPLAARKQWIVGTMKPIGTVIIDNGAVNALKKGSSLLPAGIIQVTGDFSRGDVISVLSKENEKIGLGLAGYSSNDANKIMGHKSNEIAEILNYSFREELIHKDDLVLL